MQLAQLYWTETEGWQTLSPAPSTRAPDLVLYFAAPRVLDIAERFVELRQQWPTAPLIGCTTGGEIIGDEVLDGSIVATAFWFAATTISIVATTLEGGDRAVGARLAADLPADGLKLAFVLSDGTHVNGTELVLGMRERLAADVVITGGLAGDGADFGTTKVGYNAAPIPGQVVVIGFAGAAFRLGHGSYGGWTPFGPERRITRAAGSVLHELDGQPALDLYKTYLGDAAAQLPGSALFFPLSVTVPGGRSLTRTIVGIDEAAKSMTFAGDIPHGATARLMRATADRLIDGAVKAADQVAVEADGETLALMVSCIGRKLTLGQRSAEEVEEAGRVLGPQNRRIGFYSYGELSPHEFGGFCELHNQTMTITVIGEVAA